MAGLGIPLFRMGAAQPLGVWFDGDDVRISAPDLHFLTGKPLERLKNGLTVTFLADITIFSDQRGTIFRRMPQSLMLSYALWEERFSVRMAGANPRTQDNLTAAQAEAWSLENLAISALGLSPDRQFWLRFILRTVSQKQSRVFDSGISLTGMIELLGRKPGADDTSWTRSAGPLRLQDLPRIPGRGTRNG